MAESWWEYVQRISGAGNQARIAEAANVQTSTVSRWSRGLNVPTPEAVIRVAHAYGRPAGEALVAAGLLTPDDIKTRAEIHTGARDLSDDDLITELRRRLKAR